MERPELPDVDRILEMKLKDLMKLCKDLNVDCRGFRTATQFQEAVFDYMKQYATLHQAPPVSQHLRLRCCRQTVADDRDDSYLSRNLLSV
jgi:hypothetical protein